MKKITILILAISLLNFAKAQKVYFIYLQTENQQGFYARLGEKVYNSNASGYLILSKLRDSSYTMNIGIQGSQSPEQLFSISVSKKDQGYLLKNFGDKGWGLFNLQSLAVIMPVQNNPLNVIKTEKRESNSFTDLLAKAADDSTLKERPVLVKSEEKKVEASIPETEKKDGLNKGNIDTVSAKIEGVVKIEAPAEKKEQPQKEIRDTISINETGVKKGDVPVEKKEELKAEIKPAQEIVKEEKIIIPPVQIIEKIEEGNSQAVLYQKSTVTKRSESSTTEGFGITFFDVNPGGLIDTIRILIPVEKQKPILPDSKFDDKKFLDIVSQDTVQEKIPAKQNDKLLIAVDKPNLSETELQKTNNCQQVATEDDFFKLRKKMASETNDDNMISEAKKIFKTKCFTTQQIKNLSSLFLTEDGKYKFFDAAYTHVSDITNFKSLQSELKDEYYIKRFKSMLY